MKKLLLHVCCAPCTTATIEQLKEYKITLFFSDSNIFPKEEYKKRLNETKKLAKHFNLKLIEDEYNHKEWLKHIKGLEYEPEKGKRCIKCFEFSLKRAYNYAKKYNYDLFTTTLTISPHKDNETIFKVGEKFPLFLKKEFTNFNKTIEISKKLNLYRQKYCGCEFSLN